MTRPTGGSHPPSTARPRPGLRRLALALSVVLAAETTAVLLTTGQSFAVTPASAPAQSPAAKAPAGPATAKDEYAARLKARLENRRIEVLDARGPASTTWINPDGSTTEDLATGPVRFKDAKGAWQDVDPTLVKDEKGTVRAKGHPLGLTLSAGTPADRAKGRARTAPGAQDAAAAPVPLVTLNGEAGTAVTLSWRGALPAPTVEGTRARYADALTATDLVVESTRTGFEQFLELKDRSAIAANGTVTLRLDAKGLTARANADSSVSFLDPRTGQEAGVLPAPVMWDAQVDPRTGDHARTAPVALKVSQNGDAVDLTLTPDAAFLNDPKTQYPVTVDPAVSIGVGFDTFVQQGYATDVSSQAELKLGNNGSGQVARSFLQFPMSKITGKQILSGKLNLWNFHSWSCTAKSWEVWDTGTATTATRWTAQPGWNRKWATSTATKGYSSSCGDGWVNTDITALVQAWANNGNANNTLGIRATDESDEYAWKKFNSGNAASNTPYLSVTYNTKPGLAVPVSPLSGALTNDATPTLTGKATDADGNTVQLSYEIWAANGTAALQTGKSAFTASGANAPWTPTTSLAPGAYKWRASVYDGSTWNGGWSAWQTFTVDTVKPGATTVSSGDFPAGAWSGTADAAGNHTGSFTFTPPGSDVKDIQYRLDGGAWTTVATTGTPVTRSLTFKAGQHTVAVHTRDAAGNVSADQTHVFYAGKGAALVTPGEGERPARRTSLSAQGKDSYTGVRYQYRRGETDAWKDVPTADTTTTGGAPVASWPVPVTGGKPAPLTWNITGTLSADGPVDIRAVFTDGTATDTSAPTTVTVDRKAGTAPAAKAGPGAVNTLTGDFVLNASDAEAFGLSADRTASSRRPTDGAAEDGQAAIFGPQWSSGTTAEAAAYDWAQIRRTSPTSLALVDGSGNETGFTATASGGWKPEPGAEELTLTGSFGSTFTVKDTTGFTAGLAKVDPAATTWQVVSTSLPTENSTTNVVSEKVVVNGKALARPKYVTAPTSAATAAACAAAPATKGCRVLEYVYADTTTAGPSAFGAFAGQVKQIRLWSTEPGAAAATPVVAAEYAYDQQGRLREVSNPRTSPALRTAYDYDATGRVTALTPPGELPWTFGYGKAGNAATAGEGMLLTSSRATLKAGSKDQTEAPAVTSVVYDVPLSGANAPYQLGGSDVAAWGQSDAPSDATAVFPADAVPAGHDGRTLAAGAWTRATVTYTNASGREVNTAQPGGAISTTEYDSFGNVIRQLTPGNRALALTGDQAELRPLGLDGRTTADRAQALSTVWAYSADGRRQTEELGPLHTVTLEAALAASGAAPALPAGAEVPARTRTATGYDEGRPAGAAVADQTTSVTIGARIDGYAADADTRTVATSYDWAKGLPTAQTEDPAGLALTTGTGYDAQGRTVRRSLPKSNGTDAGTTLTTYWSATGTGACAGRPEWADLLCSTGPAGAVADAGANPAELPLRTYEYDRWGKVAKVTETAAGVTRTTVTSYDALGRTTKVEVTGGLGTPVPATTHTYDPASGRPTGSSDGTTTIVIAQDRLGREVSYDDGAGSVTTTEYDRLDRPVKVADSAPSTVTYGYDTAKEPRGLATSLTDSAAGTFTGRYDADGRLASQGLPGGYVLTDRHDTTGARTARGYAAADGTTVLADTAGYTVHGQQAGHTQTDGSTVDSAFGYDRTGRLTKAQDTAYTGCTTRSYAFDKNGNRTGRTTVTEDCDPATADAVTTTTGSTHDGADRLTGTGYAYDAFGRTTSRPGGSVLGYHVNDLARSEQQGDRRTTWSLDAAGRLARDLTETRDGAGAWTATEGSTSHYSCACDSPSWSRTDAGLVTHHVRDLGNRFAAVTGQAGGTVLQLTNLHGDVAVQLPLESTENLTVHHYDEFGNAVDSAATRYGWLGGHQRASDTASGLTLMGARLYDADTGRFLQTDPVPGGNANAYTYPADPVNMYDLTGLWRWNWGWLSGTVYFNKRETKALKYRSEGVGLVLGAIGFFAAPPLIKWVIFNAGVIAWHAKQAYDYGRCVKLKWPIGYPGLIPGQYSKRSDGCR